MKQWRSKAREKLKAELGGKCWACGGTDNLTFAHVIPLTDEQASYRTNCGANKRLVLYRKEAKEGLLKLLCQSCNVKESKDPKQGWLAFNYCATQPF